MDLTTTDLHTAGEPFRIVTGGAPDIPGTSVLERRAAAQADHDGIDRVRRLLVQEPRGHADMYGCFVVAPDDDGADLGVLFWHKDGYSTACGHGTIAVGTWAVATGLVPAPDDGEVDVTLDVPSGRVVARVTRVGGRTTRTGFRNVPSHVVARGVPAAGVAVDLAWGGALYASVRAADLGLSVERSQLDALIAAGRRIKADLATSEHVRHPTDPRLDGLYGVTIYDELGHAHQRNVTIFADGEVDRSPCGSGTSARCALLHDAGELAVGEELVHESIVGTAFRARVLEPAAPDGSVLTEVAGTAHRTGEHRFVLEDDDALGVGFALR